MKTLKTLCLVALPLVVLTGCGNSSPPVSPKVEGQADRYRIKPVGRPDPAADGKTPPGGTTAN